MVQFKPGAVLAALPAFVLGTVIAAAASPAGDVVAPVPHVTVTDVGSAPGNGYLNVALQLRYRNAATLDRLTDAQSDPHSPLYQHWLTNAQFNDMFAPAPATYSRVLRSLERAGFRITLTYPNRTVIDAAAPIDLAERYFGTPIHRVMQPGYGMRFANTRAAHVPTDLHGSIVNVAGLNDLSSLHATSVSAATRGNRFRRDAFPLRGPYGGFGPAAFAQAYDFPSRHARSNHPLDGRGRKSALLADADFLDGDLAGFLAFFNVARTGPATVRIPIDGGPAGSERSADSIQTTFEVETIVGLAPGTALYVYEFPSLNSSQYITDAYNRVVADNIVDDANASFAGCEQALPADAKAWDLLAEQGAAKGITFQAPTGNRGSSQCNGLGVAAPASAPHVLAVGGTSLQVDANGRWLAETAWGGSGGGTSSVFPLPRFQRKLVHVAGAGRNLPDISFDADPLTGAAFYYRGAFVDTGALGGTSLSSSIFAAAIAQVDQAQNGRTGLAAPRLYRVWKKRGYAQQGKTFFHDILAGSNERYTATGGYDQVSGIGSVDVWNALKRP